MAHVLVITVRRYNYTEFWGVLKALRSRGHTVEIVSSRLLIRAETDTQYQKLAKVEADIKSMKGFDGLVVVSGNPEDTESHWYDPHIQVLVQEAVGSNLVIAGICASVPTIRLAARNKRVSFFPLIRSRDLLEEAGAILQTTSLSTDGNLVTAENEAITEMWATNICDLLEGKPPTHILGPSTFKRKTIARKPIPELEHLKQVQKETGKRGFK
jgi:putative intracellular protease/amidase